MANKNLNATITIGGVVAGSLGAAIGATKGKLGEVGKTIKDLERQQAALRESIGKYGKALDGIAIDKLKSVTRELKNQRAELERQKGISSAKAGMASGKETMGAGLAGLGVAGAVVGAAAFPVKAAMEFESVMLAIAKQVDGARDSSGKLTSVYFDMAKQIQMLGREMPIATNEIAEMAAAGARMGIGRDELIEFTKTSAMMAKAFELPAGQLADQMGKIRKLFGLKTQDEVRALADSVNYLDDNAISKGGDIIDFLQRAGGVSGSVKITGQQMAALGSTLLTLGERTETAGTAVNAIFGKLAAAESGTKKFRGAMAQLGLSTRAVQKGMQIDAQGTLLKVLDKVKSLPKDQQIGVLTGLVGQEHADTLAKLANGVQEYRAQIEMAGSDKAKGSMSREFQALLETTGSKFDILKNKAEGFSVSIGSALLPHINDLIGGIGKVLTVTTDWLNKNPEAKSTIVDLGISIGTAALTFGTLATAIGGAKFALNALSLAVKTNPIGIAVALLGTAALLVYKNWEPIKLFFQDLWTAITDGATAAFEWVISKLSWVGEKWREFKATLGLGGGDTNVNATVAPAPLASLPELPPVSTRGGGAVSTQTNNITINQQPGESSDALVERVTAKLAHQQGVRRRGLTLDTVGAQ